MYEFQSRIRYSEVDQEEKLTLDALLNYFQDCSTFHSEDIGAGLNFYQERSIVFVLSFWQIMIYRYPSLCENVTIGTFPYEFRGFTGNRNFYMKDSDSKMVAVANSVWTLLDTKLQRPMKLTQEIIDKYPLEPALSMEYLSRKIQIHGEPVRLDEIHVREHHLDTNHHVNNAQYVKMAAQVAGLDFPINMLRVEYKNQALFQDVLIPYVYYNDNQRIVQLKDSSGTKVYAIVEFVSS
jgi:medium-chain acyl-[acyl-carrier-protein] hydrolase